MDPQITTSPEVTTKGPRREIEPVRQTCEFDREKLRKAVQNVIQDLQSAVNSSNAETKEEFANRINRAILLLRAELECGPHISSRKELFGSTPSSKLFYF